MLFLVQEHSRLGSRIGHCHDIIGGDVLAPDDGNAEKPEEHVRQSVEEPDHWGEELHAESHRGSYRQSDPFGFDHPRSFRDKVGKKNKSPRHEGEGDGEGNRLKRRAVVKWMQPGGNVGGEGRLSHNAAKDSHRVQTDLDDREIMPRVFLQVEDPLGPVVAFFEKELELDFAGRGERNLGHGKKGADKDQCKKRKYSVRKRHKRYLLGRPHTEKPPTFKRLPENSRESFPAKITIISTSWTKYALFYTIQGNCSAL